jgi:hypothetical protein
VAFAPILGTPPAAKEFFPLLSGLKQGSAAELPQIAIPAPELMSALSKSGHGARRVAKPIPGCFRLWFFVPGYARENSRFRRIGKRGGEQLKRNRLLGMSGMDFGVCGDFFPVNRENLDTRR